MEDIEVEVLLECKSCGNDYYKCNCPKTGWEHLLDMLGLYGGKQ